VVRLRRRVHEDWGGAHEMDCTSQFVVEVMSRAESIECTARGLTYMTESDTNIQFCGTTNSLGSWAAVFARELSARQ